MALRLAELELQISKMAHQNKVEHQHQRQQEASADASKDSVAVEKRWGRPSTGESSSASASEATKRGNDASALNSFVSQSISQILDQVAPSKTNREPTLPPLSKGEYSARANSATTMSKAGETTTALRSALKSTSPPSVSLNCTCGCQEEIKAWRSRCAYAENQITLTEMRCEKTNIILEGYKIKWSQWKERIVREQYQRRMKAALSPQAAQYMSPGGSTQLGQAQAQQLLRQRSAHSVYPTREDTKRARFGIEESETSQQRRETTERNTLFNQFNSGLQKNQVRPRRSSLANSLQLGMGSANEPHVIFDDQEDSNSSPHQDDLRLQRSRELVVDSEEQADKSNECASQPMSPTFPSDLALLRRRQMHSEPEDDDDYGEGNEDGESHEYESVSPATRASQTRNQRRTPLNNNHDKPTILQQHQQRRQSVVNADNSEASLNVQSDRSSPSIFDDAEFLVSYRRPPVGNAGQSSTGEDEQAVAGEVDTAAASQTPPSRGRRQNPAADTLDTRINAGGAADHGMSPISHRPRIFVPETPVELQGITPKRKNELLGNAAEPTSPEQTRSLLQPVPEIIMIDLYEPAQPQPQLQAQPLSQAFVGELDKENVAPLPGCDSERGPDTDAEKEGDDESTESRVEQGARHGDPGRGESSNAPEQLRLHQQQPQLRQSVTNTNAPGERIFNFTERNKDKRKQMHGHDCACCRRFYELTGPLPLPDGYNSFFTPAPRPGEKEIWEKSAEERLQDRIQQISKHRVQHETPLTPPGFWDTDFPPTQDRVEWDRVAEERRDRKKQRTTHQQQQQRQQQQQQRRKQ
ncbi:hypothetical protein BGZ58_002018 [Dissophora ornata]|nr:hypothetical protein BGZ58_002018 [Dissophora ornata]